MVWIRMAIVLMRDCHAENLSNCSESRFVPVQEGREVTLSFCVRLVAPLFRVRELSDVFHSVTDIHIGPAGNIVNLKQHSLSVGAKPCVVSLTSNSMDASSADYQFLACKDGNRSEFV